MPKTVAKDQFATFVISADATISEAMARLEATGIGALAICSAGYKLCGILTDGDLRRAVIKAKPWMRLARLSQPETQSLPLHLRRGCRLFV